MRCRKRRGRKLKFLDDAVGHAQQPQALGSHWQLLGSCTMAPNVMAALNATAQWYANSQDREILKLNASLMLLDIVGIPMACVGSGAPC